MEWTSPILRFIDFLLVAHNAKFKMKYLNVKYRSWSCQDSQKLQNNASSHYQTTIFALCIYFLQYETPLFRIHVFRTRRLRPRTHVAGYFWKRRLFSPNTATAVHTWTAFLGTENGGFQYALQGRDFWKRRFIVFVWTGENGGLQIRWRHAIQGSLFHTYDSKTLRVDVDFRKYGSRKKSPFLKIPGYVWMVKYDSKTLRMDADFF